jgi:hypothetical protein
MATRFRTTKHSIEIIAERVEFGPKVAAGQSSFSRSESDVHSEDAS